MPSFFRSHRPTSLLLVLLVAPASAPAAQDAELAEALPALSRLAADEPARAEPLYEMLTGSHPRDPRIWLELGKLRLKRGADPAARMALAQAYELGSDAFRARVQAVLKAAQLPPEPEPVPVVDGAALRELARLETCLAARTARRRDEPPPGEPPPPCQGVTGARRPRPHRVAPALLAAALGDRDWWVRAHAAAHVDPAALAAPEWAPVLMAERHPAVRRAILDALLRLAPELEATPARFSLAEAYARDAAEAVRHDAWRLLFTLGKVPQLSRSDLEALVVAADRGWTSKYLARAVVRNQRDEAVRVLSRLVRAPSLDGKTAAIRLLAEEGGEVGLRRLLSAMKLPNRPLQERLPVVLACLRRATGVDLGADPDRWLEHLDRK